MKKRFVRAVCLIALGAAANGYAMLERSGSGWLDKLTFTADEKRVGLALAQTKFAFTEINKCCALVTLPPVLGEQVQARADLIIWDIWTKRYPMVTCDCAGAIVVRYFEQRVKWAEVMMDAIAGGNCADAARLMSTACWAQSIFQARAEGGSNARLVHEANETNQKIILPLRENDLSVLWEKCRPELRKWVARTRSKIERWQEQQASSEQANDFVAREPGCASTHPIPQPPASRDVFAADEPDSDEEGRAWKQRQYVEHRTSRALWGVEGAVDLSEQDVAEGVSRFECLTFLSAVGLRGLSEHAKKSRIVEFCSSG